MQDDNLDDFLLDDDLMLPGVPEDIEATDNLDGYLKLFSGIFLEHDGGLALPDLQTHIEPHMRDMPVLLDSSLDGTLLTDCQEETAIQNSLMLNQKIQKMVHQQLLNVQKSELELQNIIVCRFVTVV